MASSSVAPSTSNSSLILDPFNLLLNDISHTLSEDNLRSLIHICNNYITEKMRPEIHDGFDVFRILKHNGVISKENSGSILTIVQKIRPRRRDLVHKVKDYLVEYEKFNEDDDFFQDSCSSQRLVLNNDCDVVNIPDPSVPRVWCCSIDCCCCNCECYRLSVSNLVCLLVFLIVITILTVLAWYGDIPKVSKYLMLDEDRQSLGKYVVGILVFLTLALFMYIVVRRCYRRRTVVNPELNPVLTSGSSSYKSTTSPRSLPINSSKRKYESTTSKPGMSVSRSEPTMPLFYGSCTPPYSINQQKREPVFDISESE